MLRPGLVIIARAGIHLKLRESRDGVCTTLDVNPMDALHRPSVDALFLSVAERGSDVIAVVLTGMGDDGTAGAGSLHQAGGCILTEAESSCVVYGMPRAVAEAGFSDEVAPLDAMVEAIFRRL